MDLYMMQQKLWFKAKDYGWGWYPVTWQGWVATLVYILLLVGGITKIQENSSIKDVFVDFLIPFILSSTLFFMLAWKTGERPTWRWGTKSDGKD